MLYPIQRCHGQTIELTFDMIPEREDIVEVSALIHVEGKLVPLKSK